MSDSVLGAVLVGGASRRMGEDKASLLLDGTPMAQRVRQALVDGGARSVVHVGGKDSDGVAPLEAVADRWPGEGPLAGIATAVEHGAALGGIMIVVVAGCDQPDLRPQLIADLVHTLASAPPEAMASAVRTADGRRHPFPSAWRTSSVGPLVALVEAGERRADRGFTVGPVVEISAPESDIADLDTPDDLRRWTERSRPDESEAPDHRG